MEKRHSNILLVLSFLLVLSVNVYAGTGIQFESRTSCTGNIIMGISDTTNAHGEIASEVNSQGYNQVLCAYFAGDTDCDDTSGNPVNGIVALSGNTNAHAENISLNNYNGNNICYSNVRCITTTASCGAGYFWNILSLSSNTNAHLGAPGSYGINVCCTAVGIPFAQWTGSNGQEINQINYDSGGNTWVDLVFRNSNDATVDFVIREKGICGLNCYRNTISDVTVNPTTKTARTSLRIDKFSQGMSDGDVLQFTVAGITSGELTLNEIPPETLNCDEVFLCGDYNAEICNVEGFSDPCGVAADSIPTSEANCNADNTNCFCEWDDASSLCKAKYNEYTAPCDGCIPVPTRPCTITVAPGDEDRNGCEDGKIEYLYTNSCDNPVVKKTNVRECPAEVQLPFFGFYNFLITSLAIALIYYFMYYSHSRKKK